MVTVVQGKVCAKNHPDRLSRLATIHQRYRRTDGRTDFLWHRPDLTVGQKMTSCRFSRWRISAILDFRGPIMDFLKSPCTTSYRSSIDTIALNCLVFEKIAFCNLATDIQTDRQTDKQTNRRTNGHARCMKPLSLS